MSAINLTSLYSYLFQIDKDPYFLVIEVFVPNGFQIEFVEQLTSVYFTEWIGMKCTLRDLKTD